MLITNGIRPVVITSKNPQANAIAERAHKTIGDMIRTQLNDVDFKTLDQANLFIDSVLASTSYALRATVHRTLGVSPGAFAFGRDMMLNIPVVADWERIRQQKQAQIDYDAARENRRRSTKEYVVGDEVLIIASRPGKLDDRSDGPYAITQVYQNGTIDVSR